MPAAISGAEKTKDLILTMLKESRRQPGDRVPFCGVTITHAEATIWPVRLGARPASRIGVPSSLP
jgi:hypothetical protein